VDREEVTVSSMRWRKSNIFMNESDEGYDGGIDLDYREIEGEKEEAKEEEVLMSNIYESSYGILMSDGEREISPVWVTRVSLRAIAYTSSYHEGERSTSYRPPSLGGRFHTQLARDLGEHVLI
jgi:hypothetical protein